MYTVLKEIVYVINSSNPYRLNKNSYKEYIAFVHHSFLKGFFEKLFQNSAARLFTEMNWLWQRGTLLHDLQNLMFCALPRTNSHYVQGVHIAVFHFRVLVLHRIHVEHTTFSAEAFTIFTDYLPAIHFLDILTAF